MKTLIFMQRMMFFGIIVSWAVGVEAGDFRPQPTGMNPTRLQGEAVPKEVGPQVTRMTLRDLEKSSTVNLAEADFEALGTMVGKLNRVLSGPKVNTQSAAAWIDSLALLKKDLDRDDANIRARFASIREKIVKANLPAAILIRHDEFVKRYEEKRKQVEGALGVVLPKDSTLALDVLASTPTGDLRSALVAIEGALKSEGKRPLSPKQKKGSGLFSNVYRPIKRERVDPFGGKKPKEMKTFASNPPAPEDTMETPDVQFTKELRDLADSLGHDPRRIYEYVKNRVSFQAYHGSLKGARSTYIELSGNDYDQASLLIALLRISKIPARYRIGVLELTPEKVVNWLGVDDNNSAFSILQTSGMPFRVVKDENGLLRFWVEQCWVAAYVPMQNYMGAPVDKKGKAWVPFLPALKDLEIKPGLDVPGLSGFEGMAFFGAYIDSGRTQSPMVLYRSMLQGWLDVNRPGVKYEDTFRSTSIKFESFPILPFTDPYREISVKGEFSGLADSLRYTFEISLDQGGFDHTTDFINVANRSVVVSYSGATVEDSLTIVSFGGIFNTPPYLVRLRPVLWVGGKLASVGAGDIGMGYGQGVYVAVKAPGQPEEYVDGEMIAGGYRAVALAGQAALDPEFTRAEPESIRDYFSYSLYRTARKYLADFDRDLGELDATIQVVTVRELTEISASTDVDVKYLYGAPNECKWRGTLVNPGWVQMRSIPVGGENPSRSDNALLVGLTMSVFEMGAVLERDYGGRPVSAVSALALAESLGIGVAEVTLANMDTLLPKLWIPIEVRETIRENLQARYFDQMKVVRREIEVGDWKGGALAGFSGVGGQGFQGGKGQGDINQGDLLWPQDGGVVMDTFGMDWWFTGIFFQAPGNLEWYQMRIDVPETLSCYLVGERYRMKITQTAKLKNKSEPEEPHVTYHPSADDWYDTSQPGRVSHKPWEPGEVAIVGVKYEQRKHPFKWFYADIVRTFMLAGVKLVLDSTAAGHFDQDHKDDLPNFLPSGKPEEPKKMKLIAVLWADKGPYRSENWDAYHVDLNEWYGRKPEDMALIKFNLKTSNFKGWGTNMGDEVTEDFYLPGKDYLYTFGLDGMIKLDYFSRDYGGGSGISLDLYRKDTWPIFNISNVTVPVDQDLDGMADKWVKEVWKENFPLTPDYDNDWYPNYNVNYKGDGLTAFDEYRGFMVIDPDDMTKVKHIRTDPQTMDVFIRDSCNIGLGYFNKALQLNRKDNNGNLIHEGIHMINDEQWTNTGGDLESRVINRNKKDHNSYIQRGIKLYVGTMTRDDVPPQKPPNYTLPFGIRRGWTCSGDRRNLFSRVGTPDNTIYCKVDTNYIKRWFSNNQELASKTIQQVIAHELGHAVGMDEAYMEYDDGRPSCTCEIIMGWGGGYDRYETVRGETICQNSCTGGWQKDSKIELKVKCPQQQ